MFQDKDIVYMQQALMLARKAYDVDEVPIGALIVGPQGEVIGCGFNQTEADQCQDQHAELCAIRQACKYVGDWRLDGCTIYVTLEPCVMCLGAIVLSRIERLVYAADSPLYGFHAPDEAIYQLYAKQIKNITKGVCQAEAQELLQSFFRHRRNK